MADNTQPILDLSNPVEDRPTVKLPSGDYKMRRPEELTFTEFGRQSAIGEEIVALAPRYNDEGVLDELQDLIVEAGAIVLVDLPEDVARSMTPGMYRRINRFFNQLGVASEATPSETTSNSPAGANDSTETSAAD